jgi:hypothetical protein
MNVTALAYMPHGMCYLRNAKLIALHSVSNAIMAGFAQMVRDIVSEIGADAKFLHLEITETALTRLPHQHRHRRFATGYSSLAYLHTFPLDTLKSDRSFLSDGGEELSNPGILRPFFHWRVIYTYESSPKASKPTRGSLRQSRRISRKRRPPTFNSSFSTVRLG